MSFFTPPRSFLGPASCWVLLSSLLLYPALAGATPARLAEREILSNGMVLLHSEKRTLPIVKITLGVHAGQTEETEELAGLSSLTASLLSEGTSSRTADELNEAIEFVGGSLSAEGGGEYATISLSVLSKDLPLGFELLSDILMHPTFPESEVVRKKAQFKSSIARQKEDPGSIAGKTFARELYGNHPLAWPPEGTEESLDRINRSDIVEFHDRYYRPNRAWMAVVGDVDRDEVVALVDRFMKDWKPGEPAQEKPYTLSLPDARKIVRIDKKITQANIILGHPGIHRSHPDYYAVLVMNYILGGGGFASRLMDTVRDDMGLAYDIHSSFAPNKTTGAFEVVFQTKNESAATAVGQVLKEMERIQTEPVTDQELADAKAYITGSLPLRMDSNAKMAGLLASVEYFGLGMNYLEDYLDAVNRVTTQDVLRVAQEYLHPDRFILVVVGDQNVVSLE